MRWAIFKRDLARALLRVWFVVLVLSVSPSVKICIISCHIHNFVSVCNLKFSKNSPKISSKNFQKFLKTFWLALIGRNPFQACYGTEFEIWSGFGLVGGTENYPTYKQLLATFEGDFLTFLRSKTIEKKNNSFRAKKLHRMKI